ncbi:helix-turn-helix domain-containing protein [Candidatus Poribacteria bacterium]|nr:helix-turn-helix domain-containing protein [Candidatus Poribacteria bacterium]
MIEGISAQEAAKILNVHPQTIRRWMRGEKLSGWIVGGRYRINPDSIRNVIKPLGSEVEIEESIKVVEETFGSIQADLDLVKKIALAEDLLYEAEVE